MMGKVLANRYQVGERIGGGGMALVYRAEDMQLDRDVAIKVLRGPFNSDEEFVRRFRREATNAASLSHPNIVQIFDVGQEDDQYFIVMELVEGKTLKQMIQDQGPLPVAEASRIASEILGALTHAHQHRIVHRDIKPHNILINRNGHAKVTDFGIARATTTDTVTHTGSIMGSAHYFSPEQANGLPTGEKSDIYSAGIVLYEMVTGTVPFQGESPITVALKHIRDRVVPPSQLNPEVPVELEEIILQALEKEPDDRFDSADAMRTALDQFREDHLAGRTHIVSGDFPTMDMRALRTRKTTRAEPLLEEDDDAPAQPPSRRKRYMAWIWISLIAALVVGGVGAGVWALVNFMEVPEVAVPNIVGMPLRKATTELDSAKLRWGNVTEQFNNEYPLNTVIGTRPEPGTRVKINRPIELILSKGPEEKQLPDLRGKTEEDAKAMLDTMRFKYNVTYQTSLENEGKVIDTVPAPGTLVKVGDTVDLKVSRGALRVPAVVGKSLKDAQDLLVAAGLRVGAVTPLNDPSKAKDTVLSSDPPPGAPVQPGLTVNLVVATGAATAGKPFATEVTVPGDPGRSYMFRVVLVDVVNGVPNESTLVNEKRLAGDKLMVKGSYLGDAYLQVFADNRETSRIKLQ